jgi:hypothetical protein
MFSLFSFSTLHETPFHRILLKYSFAFERLTDTGL